MKGPAASRSARDLRLSVIMPVRNEARALIRQKDALRPLLQKGHEVIVVDGESEDESLAIARSFATAVLESPPGRACQMNAGARHATGDILLFLHADVMLPTGVPGDWLPPLAADPVSLWGFFPVRLAPPGRLYRLIAFGINLRARLTHVVSGDQGLWVRRDGFERVGGYAPLPLMEDIELSKRLRKMAPPCPALSPVSVSARRWDQGHPVRLVLRMWALRVAYACGVHPRHLVARYDPGYPREGGS